MSEVTEDTIDEESTKGSDWPFESKLVSVIKVVDSHVCHHGGEKPYYQISISGFIIDCIGGVLFTDIQEGADDDDIERVKMLQELYVPGALLHLECRFFFFGDRSIDIHGPTVRPVEKYGEDIDEFFPIVVDTGREPVHKAGEFYYCGRIYRAGKAQFRGFKQGVK